MMMSRTAALIVVVTRMCDKALMFAGTCDEAVAGMG